MANSFRLPSVAGSSDWQRMRLRYVAPVCVLLLGCTAAPGPSREYTVTTNITARRRAQEERRYSVAAESTKYNACPTGYKQVKTAEECKLAAKELGKKWFGSSIGSWGNHMPGCFEGHCGGGGAHCKTGNGNMHFNKAGHYGGNQRGLGVCVTTLPRQGSGPGGTVMPGSKWKLIADEYAGSSGSDQLRNLDFAGGGMMVRVEWGHGTATGYAEFNVAPGSTIFGDFVDPSIPVSNMRSSLPLLTQGDSVFCKMCSKSSKSKFGDTCWAILPASEKHRACGCNSGGWAGSGVYYGGYDVKKGCNVCGCRAPNAMTGPAKTGQAKGGVPSVGLRIFEKTGQEWALEELGAKILATSSTGGCAGNIHNLLLENTIHTCSGECGNGKPCTGDPRFMFGRNDDDQRILVDLGQPRYADKIGAGFSSGDREVWEHVLIQVSADNQNCAHTSSVCPPHLSLFLSLSRSLSTCLLTPFRYFRVQVRSSWKERRQT
eukprot:COSAG05_NODE_3853_length_1806_cov_2.089045_2_plen_488_part_00